jgi:DNA repair protein RecO (recombination protein O)
VLCPKPAGSRVGEPAAETISLLGALLTGDWPVVRPASSGTGARPPAWSRRTSSWHLERGLRSLAYVER